MEDSDCTTIACIRCSCSEQKKKLRQRAKVRARRNDGRFHSSADVNTPKKGGGLRHVRFHIIAVFAEAL